MKSFSSINIFIFIYLFFACINGISGQFFSFRWTGTSRDSIGVTSTITWALTGTVGPIRNDGGYLITSLDFSSTRRTGENVEYLAAGTDIGGAMNDNLIYPNGDPRVTENGVGIRSSQSGSNYVLYFTGTRYLEYSPGQEQLYASNVAPVITISTTSLDPSPQQIPGPVFNNFGGGAVGDPQFSGLSGQSYQIHGIDGGIYSIITEQCLQMNARFVFLSSGECPVYNNNDKMKPSNCWSHPGSYFGLLSFMTIHGDQILVEAGGSKTGFNKIMINNKTIRTTTTTSNTEKDVAFPIIITGHDADNNNNNVDHCSQPFSMIVHDSHHLSINYSLWSMSIDSSDCFLNLASVSVSSWLTLTQKVQPHGLLGQTWKVLRGDERGEQVPEIEGLVDDYLESNNAIYGNDNIYNKFNKTK